MQLEREPKPLIPNGRMKMCSIRIFLPLRPQFSFITVNWNATPKPLTKPFLWNNDSESSPGCVREIGLSGAFCCWLGMCLIRFILRIPKPCSLSWHDFFYFQLQFRFPSPFGKAFFLTSRFFFILIQCFVLFSSKVDRKQWDFWFGFSNYLTKYLAKEKP